MTDKAFIRFTNVTIPQGSTIRSAWARFMAYDSQVISGIVLKCYFVNADDPDAPADQAELDGFSLTSAVNWTSIPLWSDGIRYTTPDLKTILQTIVDRSGWASGNAVILIIEDNSSAAGANRKFSSYDYLGSGEKPALYVTWYSTIENFFDSKYWEPAQLDELTAIETSWSGTQWNFNIHASANGGKLKSKGTWMKNYRPGGMTVTHDHSGPVILKLYATDGILYYDSAYTSGTQFEPNWTGRSGDIEYLVLEVPDADDDVFHITNISFDSTPATAQTSTSTTSTASTTSSTASTTSTASTISTTSSTMSTTSTASTVSTSSSTSSSSSTISSTSSTASTASTATTLSSTSSTASTVSTVTTGCTTTSTTTTSTTATASTTVSSSTSTTTTTGIPLSYGSDFTGGATYDDSYHYLSLAAFDGSHAFDDSLSSTWNFSSYPSLPQWCEVDLGVGNEKTARKLRIYPYTVDEFMPTALQLKASNTGAFGGEEATLVNATSLTWSESTWKEWEFANGTAYRYYRIYAVTMPDPSYGYIPEAEMMEVV